MIKTFEQFISEECNEGLLDKLKLKKVKITSDYKKYIEDLESPRFVYTENNKKIKFHELSDFEKVYLKDIKLALKDEEVAKKREKNKIFVKEYFREIINVVKDMTVSMHMATYRDYDLERKYINGYTLSSKGRDEEYECELYELTTEIKLGDKPYKLSSVFLVEGDLDTKKQTYQLLSFYVYYGDKNGSTYLDSFSNEELEMMPENKNLDIYDFKDLFRNERFVFDK